MSGINYNVHCPNCGHEDASGYTDSKPFVFTNIDCFECWFYTTTSIGQYDLEEVNKQREWLDIGDPLDKLPHLSKHLTKLFE